MSVFSNPMSRTAGDATEYARAIQGALGDRLPLEVLAETAAALRSLVRGRPAAVLRMPESPGKWSAVEVMQHLADSELVWAYRMRMVLAHDGPRLSGYDQDRWAERLRYRQADPDAALQQFEALREINLRLVRSMTAKDLMRVAIHEERGHESLEQMLVLYAGHDLVHLRQIERISSAVDA